MSNKHQITTVKLPARINPTVDKRVGILNYDSDNAYPDRMETLISSSGRLYRCVETIRRFMTGRGFENKEANGIVLNGKRHTARQLWNRLIKDKARLNSCVLHVNYNAMYEAVEIQVIPTKFVRFVVDEDYNWLGTYAVYDDWQKKKRSRIKPEDIKIIHAYNPDPMVIEAEVTACEGWGNYNGQLLYLSEEIDCYPVAIFDPEVESAETDYRIKIFKLKNVSTGFMAFYRLKAKGKYTKQQEDELIESVESFQGSENAGKVWVEFIEPGMEATELEKIELQETDNLFEWHETSTDEKIRKVCGVPPVLLGDLIAGKMGTQREMADAVNWMNESVAETREDIFDAFQKLVRSMPQYKAVELKAVVNLKTFTPVDIPTDILSQLDTNEKRGLVNFPPVEEKSKTIRDNVNSMSPIVANNALAVMTDDEKRTELLGLQPKTEEGAPAPAAPAPTTP